jgi:hypothetical protein
LSKLITYFKNDMHFLSILIDHVNHPVHFSELMNASQGVLPLFFVSRFVKKTIEMKSARENSGSNRIWGDHFENRALRKQIPFRFSARSAAAAASRSFIATNC